jgi:tRNA pseudouridine(55) synthase
MSSNNTQNSSQSQFSGTFFVWKNRGETLATLLERFRNEKDLDDTVLLTYAGRLDPMAEGLVPVLAGDDRFNKDKMLGMKKTYEVEILFGVSTDTQDPLGIIEEVKFSQPKNLEEILEKIKSIKSLPYPAYSSVPVEGKPLFRHARDGHTVEIPEKKINIYSVKRIEDREQTLEEIVLEIIDSVKKVQGDFRQNEIIENWQNLSEKYPNQEVFVLKIEIECSSGTYMRSVAKWVGEQVHIPTIAYKIIRTKMG